MVGQTENWHGAVIRLWHSNVGPYRWLEINWVFGQFSDDQLKAIVLYINIVQEGVVLPPIWTGLKQQIYIEYRSVV